MLAIKRARTPLYDGLLRRFGTLSDGQITYRTITAPTALLLVIISRFIVPRLMNCY